MATHPTDRRTCGTISSGPATRGAVGRRLAALQAETARGKSRITIFIDDDVLAAFRARAEGEGRGYQTLMNSALRAAVAPDAAPVTVDSLRRVLREELKGAGTR